MLLLLYIMIGIILLLTKERELTIREFERTTKDYPYSFKFTVITIVIIAWSICWLPSYVYDGIKKLKKG